jgi:hypothetical protein
MTDKDLILWALGDRQWHNIIQLSQMCKPGCVNWAARSRISEINKDLISKNQIIRKRIADNGCADYRLGNLDELDLG